MKGLSKIILFSLTVLLTGVAHSEQILSCEKCGCKSHQSSKASVDSEKESSRAMLATRKKIQGENTKLGHTRVRHGRTAMARERVGVFHE